MPTGIGALIKAGVIAESTWGTVLEVTELLPLLGGEDLDSFYEHLKSNALTGSAAQRIPAQGMRTTQGKLPIQLRYSASYAFFLHFFGTDNATPIPDQYELDDSIEGNGLTVAVDKAVSVWDAYGVKASKLTFSVDDGKIIYTADVTAKGMNEVSTATTSGELAALTNTDDDVLFSELAFRIGDTANILASPTDDVVIKDFTLSIDRKHDYVHGSGSREPLEQLMSDWREAELKFTVSRYTTNQYRTWQNAQTPLQADLTFTGAGSNAIVIDIAEMVIPRAESNVKDAGPINTEVTCMCYGRVQNTVMTSVPAGTELILSRAV